MLCRLCFFLQQNRAYGAWCGVEARSARSPLVGFVLIPTGADPEANRQGAEDAAGDPVRQGLLGEDHQLAGGRMHHRILRENFVYPELRTSHAREI